MALRGRHYHLPHSVSPPTIVHANLATCSSLQSWLCSFAASLRLRLPEELLALVHLTALENDQPHGGNPPCCLEFPFARKLPGAGPLGRDLEPNPDPRPKYPTEPSAFKWPLNLTLIRANLSSDPRPHTKPKSPLIPPS